MVYFRDVRAQQWNYVCLRSQLTRGKGTLFQWLCFLAIIMEDVSGIQNEEQLKMWAEVSLFAS